MIKEIARVDEWRPTLELGIASRGGGLGGRRMRGQLYGGMVRVDVRRFRDEDWSEGAVGVVV